MFLGTFDRVVLGALVYANVNPALLHKNMVVEMSPAEFNEHIERMIINKWITRATNNDLTITDHGLMQLRLMFILWSDGTTGVTLYGSGILIERFSGRWSDTIPRILEICNKETQIRFVNKTSKIGIDVPLGHLKQLWENINEDPQIPSRLSNGTTS